MASRLSKAITTKSKKLNSLLLQYNSIVPIDDQLSWEDVTNLSSSIWLAPQPEDNLPVPRSVRLAAIDALMKEKRAIEEQELLKVEMENVLRFHLEQHASLARSISHLQSVPSVFNRGALCLLKIKQHQYEAEIKACIKFFPKLLNIPDIPFSLEPMEDCTTSVRSSLYSIPTPSSDNDLSDNEEDGDSHSLLHTGGISDLDDSSDDSKSDHAPWFPLLFSIMCLQIYIKGEKA